MATLQRTIVHTTQAPQPLGAYAQAVRVKAGELVYIAGEELVISEMGQVGTQFDGFAH